MFEYTSKGKKWTIKYLNYLSSWTTQMNLKIDSLPPERAPSSFKQLLAFRNLETHSLVCCLQRTYRTNLISSTWGPFKHLKFEIISLFSRLGISTSIRFNSINICSYLPSIRHQASHWVHKSSLGMDSALRNPSLVRETVTKTNPHSFEKQALVFLLMVAFY